MGTQTAIAERIKGKRADYVLVLKGNQGTVYEDVKEYSGGAEFLGKIKEKGNYKKTQEKAHGQIERGNTTIWKISGGWGKRRTGKA